ncbi:MAG: Rrf2 family transcriptional regulator [Myxococcales bacterium]|nr:Rrf2 family transcriptional regulator [Myxococcales bacterium]
MITGNTHFALATHILTALAVNDVPLTSARLAESVGTNPAFLRALIGRLRDAALVQTRLGAGGGTLLARDAASITLLDVYRATEGRASLTTHDCDGQTCAVAMAVPEVLRELEDRLDAVMAAELEQITILSLAQRVNQP